MQTKTKLSLVNKRGQGMTEYIIVIALVALAATVVVGQFGGDIKLMFSNSGSVLHGGTAETDTAKTKITDPTMKTWHELKN